MKKYVIIGLDGVPYELIEMLAETNVMPNINSLIQEGFFCPLKSSIPEVSCVAWSSVITGKNPGEHGIFGFVDIPYGTYRLKYPNYNDLKVPVFWESDKKQSVIINVPSTFPVRPMNGIHISGFVSLDLQRSVYPQSLIPELENIGYKIDADASKAHKSMGMFLRDLDRTLDARIKIIHKLWNNETWDIFMAVFTGTDRLMHFLWDSAFEPESRYHNEFMNHFNKIDRAIGYIINNLNKNDRIIILSDHGFESIKHEVYINSILQENGFLKVRDNKLSGMEPGSKAFSLDPARIYINKKDKYPNGSVEQTDVKYIINDITSLFNEHKIDEFKSIKNIFMKDEIYKGSYTKFAPDIILTGNEGINLSSTINPVDKKDKRKIFQGKHSKDNAFLLIRDMSGMPDIPDKPCVEDIVSIININ